VLKFEIPARLTFILNSHCDKVNYIEITSQAQVNCYYFHNLVFSATYILYVEIGIFHRHKPSGHTMALGLTQPLTEMSSRNISWGVEAAGA